MDSAFTTEEGWDGLCSWEDYPYDAPQHPSNFTCQRTNCTAVKGSKVKYFTDLSPGEGEPCSDKDFEAALLGQPLAVAVEASGVSLIVLNFHYNHLVPPNLFDNFFVIIFVKQALIHVL